VIEKVVERALELVQDGDVVGLGTGRAATAFVKALAMQVHSGLHIRGIPTSLATARLARDLELPMAQPEDVETINVTFDGADEVDQGLNLIKGYGGALVREKIVAAASRRLVILVGFDKLVSVLGARGILPVEVVPFALPFCQRRLRDMGYPGAPRLEQEAPFVTDNGNSILDCRVGPIADAAALEGELRSIPGVVGTGLFVGMADTVLVERGDTVEVRERAH